MAFRRKYIILHFTRRQSRFWFWVINPARLDHFCLDTRWPWKQLWPSLDENSRTCPTLNISCFSTNFSWWLLIEWQFITPRRARCHQQAVSCNGCKVMTLQMSMSHTMINPCQLKIQIILPGARHNGWVYFITLLRKYERIMGHFSQKYDRHVKKWKYLKPTARTGIQPERFSSIKVPCVSTFSIMMSV